MNCVKVLAACIAALFLAASLPAQAAGAPKAAVDAGPQKVDLGAFTFLVETPLTKQYVVAAISIVLEDQAAREKYERAQYLVRLRDAALSEILGADHNPIGGDVDLDFLSSRVRMALATWIPSLADVEIALLGQYDVPRR